MLLCPPLVRSICVSIPDSLGQVSLSSFFGCSVSLPPPLSRSLLLLPHLTSLSGTFCRVSSSSLSMRAQHSRPFMQSNVCPESRAPERSLTASSWLEKPRAESSEGLITARQCRSEGVAVQSGPPGWEGRQTTHGPVVGIWQRSHRGELPSVSPSTCEEVADGPWAWMGSVLEGSVLANTL